MEVCILCTGNPYLKEWIGDNGRPGRCSFGHTEGQVCVDARAFVEYVDGVIRRHYTPVEEDGEPAGTVVSRAASISLDLARMVTDVRHADEDVGGTFYDYGPLAFGGSWSMEDSARWGRFKKLVKHEARFFGAEARTILDSVFGDLDHFCGGIVIRDLREGEQIYRGRLAGSAAEANEWFKSPAVSLHAPPREKATAGRMNPAGVRAFYGALAEQIAVAELRPPIGSNVVVGCFTPTRPLRVLDLGTLGDVFEYDNLFSPTFGAVSRRLTFLRTLEQEISLPVQPHQQMLDYIPTQVAAEYVSVVLGLDGIAYRSAQVGEIPGFGQLFGDKLKSSERNVVLFAAAGITLAEQAPEGIQPGLGLVDGSVQMLDITKIEVAYQQNMWAHYPDDPGMPDE